MLVLSRLSADLPACVSEHANWKPPFSRFPYSFIAKDAKEDDKMLDRRQKIMIGHAALILLVALVAGICLLVSLVGGLEVAPGRIYPLALPGEPGAWARTHVGGILNALLVIAVALVLPGLGFSDRAAGRIGWALVGTGWANTLFYWAALLAPNRALTIGANPFGHGTLPSIIGYVPGLIFAIVSLVAVAAIARQAFRSAG